MKKPKMYPEILTEETQLGPYPMEKLKRVDKPTTLITNQVQRVSDTEHGFNRAARGDFGPLVQKEFFRFVPKYPLSGAQLDMTKYLAVRAENIEASSKAPLPEDPEILSRHIKSVGYFLGADIVGICQLPQYAVYAHYTRLKGDQMEVVPVELNHKFAIAVVVDQDYRTLDGSTGHDWISNSLSFRAYSISSFISRMLADYIRRLGYPARAHHFFDYQLVLPPLLLLAGIGEMCRIGVALNPFLGVRFKAAAITTDLPLLTDKPIDFGLQDFCNKCKKCATACPPKAISKGDKVMYNGYEIWKPNIELCTKFRVTNQNGAACSHCIKACPWNKPEGWTHDTVRWLIQRAPFLNDFFIKMDDFWGYGKQNVKNKWWFDLEDVDGKIQIPTNRKI